MPQMHLTPNGKSAICRATVRPCPYTQIDVTEDPIVGWLPPYDVKQHERLSELRVQGVVYGGETPPAVVCLTNEETLFEVMATAHHSNKILAERIKRRSPEFQRYLLNGVERSRDEKKARRTAEEMDEMRRRLQRLVADTDRARRKGKLPEVLHVDKGTLTEMPHVHLRTGSGRGGRSLAIEFGGNPKHDLPGFPLPNKTLRALNELGWNIVHE